MADSKLTGLPFASVLALTDEIYIVQAGFSRRTDLDTLTTVAGSCCKYRTVTAATDTVLADDSVIYVDAPLGGTVETLPLLSTVDEKVFQFRNIDSANDVTIETSVATDLLEGVDGTVATGTPFVLKPGEAVRLHATTAGYWVL